MASAPAEIAAMALPASPIPQIFTSGRRATLAGSVGAAPAATKERTVAAGSPAPHERLADERAIEPLRPPAGDGLGGPDAGLGDHQPVVRHELAQPAGTVRIDVERPQVAVVDADQAGVGVERESQLALVVRLHERLEPERQRPLDELAQAACPGAAPRAAAPRPRRRARSSVELARVDDELLGEDRDRHRRADRAQVVDRAAEPVRLAQDRDGGGAAGLVGAGTGDDVLAVGRDAARRTATTA